MTENTKPHRQQLVAHVKHLHKIENNLVDASRTKEESLKHRVQQEWIAVLTEWVETESLGPIAKIASRQMKGKNRIKPVGLFFNMSDLVELQDERLANDSTEAKRYALVESFWWWGEQTDFQTISRTISIPTVAVVLESSKLPTEDLVDADQYVKNLYQKFESNKQADNQLLS